MLSEMVCAGTRQNLRTTKGGTIPTQATATQFKIDEKPIMAATRRTTIGHPANKIVLVFSESMIPSVATRTGPRCSGLHRGRKTT